MTEPLLIESHYLPNLEYFFHILQNDHILIESCENFQKQTYRNRCHILTANKVDILSVPVINLGRKVLIKEVEIDYSQKWLNVHWGAIKSGYGKAPFFEYYAEFFHDILYKKHRFLFDLNIELMTLCLKLLRVDKKIGFTSFYEKKPENKIDLRSQISPKKDNSPYIITWTPYTQLFGSNFVPDLSIIDLLFCEGTNAGEILKRSKRDV
ncbi:MAG: WbqC family protein [Cytophagaceae bacterium]|nr:WbqC family protein [Cytophagaceae bacterium]